MATPTSGGGNLTSADVLAYARRVSETGASVGGPNLCQRFVRMAFGSAGGASTAVAAWRNTPVKHTKGTPPPGTAVYWGGGAGHSAVSAGNGYVYTTDWTEPGKVSLARIDDITQKWGKPLLGWTTQTNERKITRLNAQPVEGVGAGKYEPNYAANAGKQGGPYATTGEGKKALRQRYGYAAALYEGVPEIQRLVKMGQAQGWTAEEFQHRVQASKWYRNHTEEERQWKLLSTSQPGEVAQRINQKATDLRSQFRQLGIPVDPARLTEIATASLKHGWTDQQERNALVAEFDYDPKQTFGGRAGATVDDFRQMAQKYVVPLSDATLEKWTESVLRGDGTADDFQTYLKTQAKSLFPELSDAIDRGVTVDDYLSPYRETAARTLGINPDDVNWSDDKWSQAVFQTDDKGGRKIMGLADYNRMLRTDNRFGYDKTPGAQGEAASFTAKLAQMMGVQ